MPRIMLATVDLPDPDSPTIARHSPSATSKETSSTARTWCAPWVKSLLTERRDRSGVTGSPAGSGKFVLYGAPLCPAGHLPHKGGDQLSFRVSPTCNVAD